MNFIEELKWRGLFFDATPGCEEHLMSGSRTGYVGFDPSAPSLHIGNLVQIILLVHFQRAGHKPIALVGGATGMIGDPSGKSEERKLLSEQTIREYEVKIKDQLSRFLDFDSQVNAASIRNNYEWYNNMHLLTFLRDAGKHLTVNYMLAKESVKSRLETGISFTEFTYQLLQGFDFYWLRQHHDCTLQMGGSDQWGNITAGIEFGNNPPATGFTIETVDSGNFLITPPTDTDNLRHQVVTIQLDNTAMSPNDWAYLCVTRIDADDADEYDASIFLSAITVRYSRICLVP